MNQHFPVKAATRFLWHDGDGALRMGVGTTCDISRHGVFVAADCVPAADAEVQLIVDMTLPGPDRQTVQLLGQGVTVRIARRDGQPVGFAAEVLFQPGWASLLTDRDHSIFDDAGLAAQTRDRPLVPAAFYGENEVDPALVPATVIPGLAAAPGF